MSVGGAYHIAALSLGHDLPHHHHHHVQLFSGEGICFVSFGLIMLFVELGV